MKKPSLFGAVCAVLFTAAPLSVNATTVWSAELKDKFEALWTLHVITDSDNGVVSVYLDSATDNGTVDPADLLTCHPDCADLVQGYYDAVSLLSDDYQPYFAFYEINGTSYETNGTLIATLNQETLYYDPAKSGTLTCNPFMDLYKCTLTNSNLTGPSGDLIDFLPRVNGDTITFTPTPTPTPTQPLPPSPTTKESIEHLVTVVIALNLHNGISNALDSKLDSAIQALDDANTNNDVSVSNSLYAFKNSVEAQRGNKLSNADADYLRVIAEAIIYSLTQ